jgi:hypothetical protein
VDDYNLRSDRSDTTIHIPDELCSEVDFDNEEENKEDILKDIRENFENVVDKEKVPLELKPREVRRDEGGGDHFKIDDMYLKDDDKPERFFVDIFKDFVTCSQDLTRNLINSSDQENFFSADPISSNPLLLFDTDPFAKLSIPIGINKNSAPKDEYGQLRKNLVLDELFNFYTFESDDDKAWNKQLVENYVKTREIEDDIKRLEYRKDY